MGVDGDDDVDNDDETGTPCTIATWKLLCDSTCMDIYMLNERYWVLDILYYMAWHDIANNRVSFAYYIHHLNSFFRPIVSDSWINVWICVQEKLSEWWFQVFFFPFIQFEMRALLFASLDFEPMNELKLTINATPHMQFIPSLMLYCMPRINITPFGPFLTHANIVHSRARHKLNRYWYYKYFVGIFAGGNCGGGFRKEKQVRPPSIFHRVFFCSLSSSLANFPNTHYFLLKPQKPRRT